MTKFTDSSSKSSFQKAATAAAVTSAVLGASLFLVGQDTRKGLSDKAREALEVVTAGRTGDHRIKAWADNYKAAAGQAAGKVAQKVTNKLGM